jgi:predicted metal-dependent peptidase
MLPGSQLRYREKREKFMFGMKQDAMRRMLTARERVARRNPFFASILFNANLIESKAHQTVWTDGLNILFNPDYVEDKKSGPFLEGVMLKTVLHCAMLHMSRKRYREMERWNKSCSYPVNRVVEDYFKMPPDALRDKKFGELAPEQVYELLQQQEEKKPQKGPKQKGGKGQPQKGQGQPDPDGDGEGEGEGDGDGEGEPKEQPGSMFEGDGEGQTPQEQQRQREDAERQWKRAVAGAMEKSPPGTMPGNLQRLIQDLFPAEKLDWKDLIRDMSRDAKSNTVRTWQRPNRRRLGGGEYMPGNGNDQVFKLVMCMDVSGSVSQKMIQEMCEEAASLLEQNLVNHVTLISVDTQIQNTLEAKSAEDIVGWNAGGGGGTDFRSAMKTVGEMSDVVGCIFLTDMMTSSFGDQPEFPVVWVDWTNGGSKAPYGRTVPYK